MRIQGICLVGIVLQLCACAASRPMALGGRSADLTTGSDSLVLFTLQTANEYRRDFQPLLRTISVRRRQGGAFSGEPVIFNPGKPYHEELGDSYTYLVSLRLRPGAYTLETAAGTSSHDMIVATFSIPLQRDFVVPAERIVYLGHITATNRERLRLDQLPAGAAVPAYEQESAGFADGTFEISVSDDYTRDLEEFTRINPALARRPVKNLAGLLAGNGIANEIEALQR